jgi:hypothetical protein
MDNITLVPASLLPFKEQWRQCAGAVSSREALFIVPEGEIPLRRTMRQLVPYLRAGGRQVIALSAKQFGSMQLGHAPGICSAD